jgi:hypothetical protein
VEEQLRGRIGLPTRRLDTDRSDHLKIRPKRFETGASRQPSLPDEVEELVEVEKD